MITSNESRSSCVFPVTFHKEHGVFARRKHAIMMSSVCHEALALSTLWRLSFAWLARA